MIIRCGLMLLLLSCAKTTEEINKKELVVGNDIDMRFSSYAFWPSVHNAAKIMRLRKRQVQEQIGASEGGNNKVQEKLVAQPAPTPSSNNETIPKPELPKEIITTTTNDTVNTVVATTVSNETKANETTPIASVMNINNPGVLKRSLIVFGGFGLLAVAYFIFYRRKNKRNDSSNTHSTNDANQFRYGVLQSDDRRDNMELSRVPLTMESDDDEEEDLEIFDLKEKKKSLSYVNLEIHDEDLVLNSPTESNRGNSDRQNLLLDIEDASSDTLINWSNNGNKSIL